METEQSIVRAEYKTGQYIGRVVETDGRRTLVEVLAVLRHPTQGDLHSSFNPDAALFHERRASAYREKVWALSHEVKPYGGEIPEYRESLAAAFGAEAERIDRMKRWAERCQTQLDSLKADYGI
ncbi:sporulation phosphorelay system protein KapB [Cohnella nanjingensis]|uniref:Kinase n=1 Tax=Cohnella nanjingensis TaxID=1387779 RepID=A0A7X0RQC4_9BACL|nr:sporulation phosphorelay system protein KapB [Cohnella nanjingensis]MBB6671744.1 kinase [Cohnella nanjingensis]